MRKKILLTGGTGFIGSFLAHRLLCEGYEVKFLVRGHSGQSTEERVQKALRFIDPKFDFQNQYEVVEGDITKSNLGIKSDVIQRIRGQVDEIWHCAASLSFKDEEAEKTYQINVEGTRNVLEFATKMEISRFHYLSTAYVAGNRLGRVYENELDCGQKFRNPYEQTKFEAEKLVKQWERENQLKTSIYRLGIVVGESKTGCTSTFAGYYTLARNFYLLRKITLGRLKRNRERYTKSGILLKDSFLALPIRIPCFPRGTVNIIPIDYVAKAICSLAKNKGSIGKIFHIINQSPPNLKWLFNASLEILGIQEFQLVNVKRPINLRSCFPGVSTNEVIRELELEIIRNCGVYFPYLFGEPVFDTRNVDRLLDFKLHFPVAKEFLELLLKYAIEREFGKCLEREISPPAVHTFLQALTLKGKAL